MNIKVAVLLLFAIAYGLGFFMGKPHETTPTPPETIVKKETNFRTQETGIVGPCKSYIVANQTESFGHATFTVVCPKEYTVSTTTLY